MLFYKTTSYFGEGIEQEESSKNTLTADKTRQANNTCWVQEEKLNSNPVQQTIEDFQKTIEEYLGYEQLHQA